MTDWQDKYAKNPDGFLYCLDFINQSAAISPEAKSSVVQAIVDGVIRPGSIRRALTNPATHKALERSL